MMEQFLIIGYINMKHKVETQELAWMNCIYYIEADSEEEIKEMEYEELQDGFYSENYDCLDHWEIISIKPVAEDED